MLWAEDRRKQGATDIRALKQHRMFRQEIPDKAHPKLQMWEKSLDSPFSTYYCCCQELKLLGTEKEVFALCVAPKACSCLYLLLFKVVGDQSSEDSGKKSDKVPHAERSWQNVGSLNCSLPA